MNNSTDLIYEITRHRLYDHPMWRNWSKEKLTPEVTGAMFHQIQKFCASTRPGLNFPSALRAYGMETQAGLLEEIAASEQGHGADLATMAGGIVNRCATSQVFSDVHDTEMVEQGLKRYSDALLGNLPHYRESDGLTLQARNAIAVFERRAATDRETTLRNLGTSLALEINSNQSIIPGEKAALIDSGHYGVSLEDAEMYYIRDHWGCTGAEQQHEANVIAAVESVLDTETLPFIEEGMNDFLESLSALWDLLDAALLASGEPEGV
jgi:hypothetical protein